jgi:hypothetical protein
MLRHPIHQTFKNLCKNLQKLQILSDAAANISHLNLKAVFVAGVIWEVQQKFHQTEKEIGPTGSCFES